MNDRLERFFNKAKEQRIFLEESESTETIDSSDDEASMTVKKDKKEKKKDKDKDIISGTVRRVFAFSGNADNAADSVAVVYVSGSHTVNVRGKNVRIAAKTLIPVILTGNVAGQVDLAFNESSLQFEIIKNSKDEDIEDIEDIEDAEDEKDSKKSKKDEK